MAALPGSGTTQVELTAAADDAVYRSKRAGKNRVSLSESQLGDDGDGPGELSLAFDGFPSRASRYGCQTKDGWGTVDVLEGVRLVRSMDRPRVV